MSTFHQAMTRQKCTMRSIERVLPNFKKLGKEKMTAAITQNRRNQLEKLFEECSTQNAELHALVADKEQVTIPYFSDNHFDACEEIYHESSDFMADWLDKVTPSPSTPVPEPGSNCEASGSSRRLPSLQLPTFDGTHNRWETFRDEFKSMVVADRNLSNIDKMHYLCSALTGEAKAAIMHLPITAANFKIAWDIIQSQYENKRRLINTHLTTLLSLPHVNTESPKAMRSLRDRLNGAINALRNLDRPVDAWSDILVFIGVQRLDHVSRKDWELRLGNSTEFPQYKEFDNFLESRIHGLEFFDQSNSEKPVKTKALSAHVASTAAAITCPVCNGGHLIYKCTRFLAKTSAERCKIIKSQRRCINCFSAKHSLHQCRSQHHCRECQQRHHTLLHVAFNSHTNSITQDTPAAPIPTDEISSHVLVKPVTNGTVLLSTARVRVYSATGKPMVARALLDQGSATTLITDDLARRLRLRRTPHSVCITGIGTSESLASHTTVVRFSATDCIEPAYTTTAVVLKSLTRYTPSSSLAISDLTYLSDLRLADHDPMSSDPIELLLGADIYGQLLTGELRRRASSEPIAQATTLGWILSGPAYPSKTPSQVGVHHIAILERLDESIRRFWEFETLPIPIALSPDDERCETHFRTTHSRSESGRYIVRLPFTQENFELGDSRSAAAKCLLQLERRFSCDPEIALEYKTFMQEYESLGHMKRVESPAPARELYYIPHHAVFRASSSTSRLRVVFNASRKTSNGKSLNDLLLSGPKLQQNLPAILMRWRQYKYVYSADIAKMYRQILIHDNDANFQRILWRNSQADPILEYQLRTVTYGTSSAPYHAIRVLQQLVRDDGQQYPLATPVLQNQTYVDDCLFGANDPSQIRDTRDQLVSLLKGGGFRLRKWASNNPALLDDIDPSDHGLAFEKSIPAQETLSVLGIVWNPTKDKFHLKTGTIPKPSRTKRAILSEIARLFDPLGWIAPTIVTAKIIMQQLWQARCDWDDDAPAAILDLWNTYCHQLPRISEISIPRFVSSDLVSHRELHGFADASARAFAAVVYQRNVTQNGQIQVALLAAKTRVAPIKTLSIPRLELSAALLLSELISFVRNSISNPELKIHCWTDSSITLWWLKKPPNHLKTFVANRISKIQQALPNATWHHVPTDDNPADCASRGLLPSELLDHPLWWSGPPWLSKQTNEWPITTAVISPDAPREERTALPSYVVAPAKQWHLTTRYSSWPKLLRVTAYVMRFVTAARKINRENTIRPAITNHALALHPEEISQAKLFWLKTIQAETFPSEILQLQNNRPLSKRSAIGSLAPFIDSSGLMRARGRLRHSPLTIGEKTPIILRSHTLLSAIIRHVHLQTLHGESTLTLAVLRKEYWILRARTTVRAILHQCVVCARERAALPSELMGDLPPARVTPDKRAFVNTGVDYAGPILVRTAPGRGHKTHKAYIAVFVCMATKAVHLELVNDYSSNAFIAAFQRFISRRGRPTSMFSDNGTNFHGANRQLSDAIQEVSQNIDFINHNAVTGIKWHFSPPAAPHFGGLWEAAVKSLKHHLKRCIGAHTLTTEEMTTLLCQIEACLNSRPIAAVSENLDDYQALTPGHFLVGTSLLADPQPSVLNLNEHRLSRWHIVQKVTEQFWKSWSVDYLHTLHQRPKWKTIQRIARVGQIVLLRTANAPPCTWALGRITACHPGSDGLTRVVTVKTSSSEFIRPLTRVCFLPVAINEIENQQGDSDVRDNV